MRSSRGADRTISTGSQSPTPGIRQPSSSTVEQSGRQAARCLPPRVSLLVSFLFFIAFLVNGPAVTAQAMDGTAGAPSEADAKTAEQSARLAGTNAEQDNENFLTKNLRQRIYLGAYSSYFDDNIRLMQVGYDCALQLIDLTPDFNLLDFALGLDALVAFDDRGGPDQGRPINARITPGIELNWSLRIYVLPLGSIGSRLFLEGAGMTLIAYARPYPDNGTYLNIGSHVGLGIDYPLSTGKGYTTLRLFHSSNGKPYEENPALNAIGIMTGIQLK